MTKQQPEALRLAECLEDLRYTTKQQADEASAMLRNQHAEIDRLRAELEESEQKIRIWRTTFLHAETERGAYKMECDRLRAELEALRNQEPVAWCATDESGEKVEALSFNKSRRRFDTPLYFAAGAQPETKGA